jgi:hypothetical protein
MADVLETLKKLPSMADGMPKDTHADARDETHYRVTLHEEAGDKFQMVFECMAQDEDHAVEQAINAYPGCVIVHAMAINEENPRP